MSKKLTGKQDKRFEKISTDPKFKEIPKKVKKVEIKDPRFASMFKDKSFNEGLNKKDLERYYMIDKEEEEADEIEQYEDIEEEDGVEREDIEMEGDDSDTSEEFEEFLQDYETQNAAEDPFAEIEQKEIPTGDETHRISVMNIDWENIHAVDLFVLFSSACKGKSKILKVEIYPSEFGVKEMERERVEGPSKEIFESQEEGKGRKNKFNKEKVMMNMDDISDDEENQEGLNPLKLRKYELKKLRYYYAIVYCGSKETALSIYNEMDGMEIERTQNFMDLRFVPDSLTGFPYPPKEVCDKIPADYQPKFYENSALQHSNVKLTWEAEDPRRNELLSKAFSKEQFKEEEIQQLLMSSDSETDEDAKLFAESILKQDDKDDADNLNLLKRKRDKGVKVKDGETIEITFDKGFEGVNDKISINRNPKDKSTWDKYLEKKKNIRREKKMQERNKKEEKKQKRQQSEGGAASKKELNLLIDQSLKNKSFKQDTSDQRFEAIKKDSRFAIDPTSKEYKNMKKSK